MRTAARSLPTLAASRYEQGPRSGVDLDAFNAPVRFDGWWIAFAACIAAILIGVLCHAR